jgi:hypothetical protein
VQYKLLDSARGRRSQESRDPSEHLLHAPGRELMQIGMPGEGESYSEPCRENGTENSKVARTRDVNDVGPEELELLLHGFQHPV